LEGTADGKMQASAPPMDHVDMTRFHQLCTQNELNPTVAEHLWECISTCEVVLVCDDSDSMSKPLCEEGTDPFAPRRTTRWSELKKLASVVIDFVTATNHKGMDIYFLNRPKVTDVQSMAGLQAAFNDAPRGGTPLISCLGAVFRDKAHINYSKLLIVVITTESPPTEREWIYTTCCAQSPTTSTSPLRSVRTTQKTWSISISGMAGSGILTIRMIIARNSHASRPCKELASSLISRIT